MSIAALYEEEEASVQEEHTWRQAVEDNRSRWEDILDKGRYRPDELDELTAWARQVLLARLAPVGPGWASVMDLWDAISAQLSDSEKEDPTIQMRWNLMVGWMELDGEPETTPQPPARYLRVQIRKDKQEDLVREATAYVKGERTTSPVPLGRDKGVYRRDVSGCLRGNKGIASGMAATRLLNWAASTVDIGEWETLIRWAAEGYLHRSTAVMVLSPWRIIPKERKGSGHHMDYGFLIGGIRGVPSSKLIPSDNLPHGGSNTKPPAIRAGSGSGSARFTLEYVQPLQRLQSLLEAGPLLRIASRAPRGWEVATDPPHEAVHLKAVSGTPVLIDFTAQVTELGVGTSPYSWNTTLESWPQVWRFVGIHEDTAMWYVFREPQSATGTVYMPGWMWNRMADMWRAGLGLVPQRLINQRISADDAAEHMEPPTWNEGSGGVCYSWATVNRHAIGIIDAPSTLPAPVRQLWHRLLNGHIGTVSQDLAQGSGAAYWLPDKEVACLMEALPKPKEGTYYIDPETLLATLKQWGWIGVWEGVAYRCRAALTDGIPYCLRARAVYNRRSYNNLRKFYREALLTWQPLSRATMDNQESHYEKAWAPRNYKRGEYLFLGRRPLTLAEEKEVVDSLTTGEVVESLSWTRTTPAPKPVPHPGRILIPGGDPRMIAVTHELAGPHECLRRCAEDPLEGWEQEVQYTLQTALDRWPTWMLRIGAVIWAREAPEGLIGPKTQELAEQLRCKKTGHRVTMRT